MMYFLPGACPSIFTVIEDSKVNCLPCLKYTLFNFSFQPLRYVYAQNDEHEWGDTFMGGLNGHF